MTTLFAKAKAKLVAQTPQILQPTLTPAQTPAPQPTMQVEPQVEPQTTEEVQKTDPDSKIKIKKKNNADSNHSKKRSIFNFHDPTIKIKIKTARYADQEAKRSYNAGDYIDIDWVKKTISKLENKCPTCDKTMKLKNLTKKDRLERDPNQPKKDPDVFSFRRLDWNLPFIKSNCTIMCFQCSEA